MRVNIRLVYGVKFGPALRIENSALDFPFDNVILQYDNRRAYSSIVYKYKYSYNAA